MHKLSLLKLAYYPYRHPYYDPYYSPYGIMHEIRESKKMDLEQRKLDALIEAGDHPPLEPHEIPDPAMMLGLLGAVAGLPLGAHVSGRTGSTLKGILAGATPAVVGYGLGSLGSKAVATANQEGKAKYRKDMDKYKSQKKGKK